MAEDDQNETVEETTPAPEAAEAVEPPAASSDDAQAAKRVPGAAPATPKERRQRSRAKRVARSAAQATRTPEERQAQRDAARVKKATRRRAERAKLRAKGLEARAAAPAEATAPREHGSGRQKERQGVVISDKPDKTIVVRIDVARRHRRYEKIVRSSSTLHAHDERNDAHEGDTVLVRESRPLSRTKRWRLVEVVERAK